MVVVDSLEMSFHSQSTFETVPTIDLGEAPRTHEEVREGVPSRQITSLPDKATSSWPGRSRLLLPDRLLLYSYIPSQGPAPPTEEVSALGSEGT